MASNRRKTANPANQQESVCPASISYPPEAENMARTDSGYYSNLSNRPGYYGDPSSALQEEEAEDYQGDDTAMNWQYYNMEGVEPHYDQQQYSNFIVGGAGSHMAGYYQDDSTPRTSVVDHGYEASQDMDLDDSSDTYFKVEPQWPTDMDTLPHYPQETYHAHAESSTMSPTTTQTDASPATFFDTDTPSTAPSTTPTSRRRLPHRKPATTKPPTPEDKHQPPLASPQTTPTTTTTTNKFPCLMGACNKQFNRAADLDRHMKFIHCKATVRPWLCDYRRCPRHKTPFHRADHFRDHLRDQHKEDLLKRGEAGGAPDAGWWGGRAPGAVYQGWWRCSKCFARVSVETDGWQCGGGSEASGGCGNFCEVERQGVRRLPVVCDHLSCEVMGVGERETWLSPGKFREHLRSCHGEDVPVKEGRDGERELMDQGWRESRDATLVYAAKWRCTRCLDAVDSSVDGFVCSRCGFVCEEVRRGWHGGF